MDAARGIERVKYLIQCDKRVRLVVGMMLLSSCQVLSFITILYFAKMVQKTHPSLYWPFIHINFSFFEDSNERDINPMLEMIVKTLSMKRFFLFVVTCKEPYSLASLASSFLTGRPGPPPRPSPRRSRLSPRCSPRLPRPRLS